MKSLKAIHSQPNLGILDKFFLEEGNPFDSIKDIDYFYNKVLNDYNFKETLKQRLNSTQYLEELSYHAYFHSNGFEKYVLDSFSEFGIKLRLHIWWEQNPIIQNSNIHNHSWVFTSKILNGGYYMSNYKIAETGIDYFMKDIPTLKNPLITNNVEEVKLQELFRMKVVKGSVYKLLSSELHSVDYVENNTISLVLQNTHEADTTKIFFKKIENKNTLNVQNISVEDIKSKLTKTLNFI